MTPTSATSIALSGASAASHAQRVSAGSIANLNTDGYSANKVSTETAPGGGVQTNISPTEAPAPLVQRNGVLVALSNADLTGEIVTQLTAAASYKANLAVISTSEEMHRAALDIVA